MILNVDEIFFQVFGKRQDFVLETLGPAGFEISKVDVVEFADLRI